MKLLKKAFRYVKVKSYGSVKSVSTYAEKLAELLDLTPTFMATTYIDRVKNAIIGFTAMEKHVNGKDIRHTLVFDISEHVVRIIKHETPVTYKPDSNRMIIFSNNNWTKEYRKIINESVYGPIKSMDIRFRDGALWSKFMEMSKETNKTDLIVNWSGVYNINNVDDQNI